MLVKKLFAAWEKKGKVKSVRTPGGHRRFADNSFQSTWGKAPLKSLVVKPQQEGEVPSSAKEIIFFTKDAPRLYSSLEKSQKRSSLVSWD